MRAIQTKQIKDLTLIALLSAILFVQQLALSMLPNIQFTTLLIVLYTKVIGFKKTTLIIFIHVIISNFFSPYGTVNPMFLPSMFIAWMLIPISLHTIFKKVESPFALAFVGFAFGFIYGWTFIPVSVYILDAPLTTYFLMDLPFEIVMAISNFLTILWLYEPLKSVLEHQKERYYQLVK